MDLMTAFRYEILECVHLSFLVKLNTSE